MSEACLHAGRCERSSLQDESTQGPVDGRTETLKPASLLRSRMDISNTFESGLLHHGPRSADIWSLVPLR